MGTPLQLQHQPHSFPYAVRQFALDNSNKQCTAIGMSSGAKTANFCPPGTTSVFNGSGQNFKVGPQDQATTGGPSLNRNFLSPQDYQIHGSC
jgi:hypothetical protein